MREQQQSGVRMSGLDQWISVSASSDNWRHLATEQGEPKPARVGLVQNPAAAGIGIYDCISVPNIEHKQMFSMRFPGGRYGTGDSK
jgi:hypothetical protein